MTIIFGITDTVTFCCQEGDSYYLMQDVFYDLDISAQTKKRGERNREIWWFQLSNLHTDEIVVTMEK